MGRIGRSVRLKMNMHPIKPILGVTTDEQWQLIRLHHLGDHSITDIARETNKSVDSVKSNLYRARKVLLAR